MKILSQYILLLMTLLVAVACNSDNDVPGEQTTSLPLSVSAVNGATRAYWQDDTPQGGSAAVFHWEKNSTDVQAVVYRAAQSRFLQWDGGGFSSACAVTPLTDTRMADITSTLNVQDAIVGAKVYLVANGSAITANASLAESTLSFPEAYDLSAPDNLSLLKAYTYMYASTQIESVTTTTLNATPVQFDAAVACLRFIVQNPSRFPYRIRAISMSTTGGTKLFPDHLVWHANNSGLSIEEPASDANYRSSMQTQANTPSPTDASIGGIEIAPETTQTYYMIIPPISNWRGVTELQFRMTYSSGTSIMTTPPSVLSVSKIPNGELQQGKIYNLHFREMILDVDHVTVDEWILNNVNVGQITVSTTALDIPENTMKSVRVNAGHTDTSKLTATSKNGKVTTVFRVQNEKVYADITAGATVGEDEVTINDQVSNSFATVSINITE